MVLVGTDNFILAHLFIKDQGISTRSRELWMPAWFDSRRFYHKTTGR